MGDATPEHLCSEASANPWGQSGSASDRRSNLVSQLEPELECLRAYLADESKMMPGNEEG